MNGLPTEIRTTFIVAILVLLLFIAFIIFFILYYKKRQLQVQIEQNLIKTEFENQLLQKELENVKSLYNERQRISMDIHDDLGSEINGIRLRLEGIQGDASPLSLSDDLVKTTINQLSNVSRKMKELIWSLEISNDSLEDFIIYLRHYAASFFEHHPIGLSIDIPEDIPDLRIDGTLRRNVFLCIKEALNNIYKHSQAEHVWLKIILTHTNLHIDISDDGVGITEETKKGNGLVNMKNRIENSGGEFVIENNSSSKGVSIQIKFLLVNLDVVIRSYTKAIINSNK